MLTSHCICSNNDLVNHCNRHKSSIFTNVLFTGDARTNIWHNSWLISIIHVQQNTKVSCTKLLIMMALHCGLCYLIKNLIEIIYTCTLRKSQTVMPVSIMHFTVYVLNKSQRNKLCDLSHCSAATGIFSFLQELLFFLIFSFGSISQL